MNNPNDNNKPGQNAPAGGPATGENGARSRRSSRVTIAIPVVVYGKGPDQKIFVENVTTSVVNAHGGKFTMQAAVGRMDTLVLKNPRTGVEARCRMVYVKDASSGLHEAGVEFIEPAPRFWGIAFPPSDWDRSNRKLPTAPSSQPN